jgi:serine/threonine-protein kinase
MRFIKGESLQEAIKHYHHPPEGAKKPGERTLEFRQLLRRFLDVCNTVAFAHSHGVLHRDLKPGNVMLGPYGETLVVDWGLAKKRDEGGERAEEREMRGEGRGVRSEGVPTQVGQALGTPEYMSPEQAEGRWNEVGPTSDVYSLGAILYSLLTARPPVQDATTELVMARVRRGDFPRPRHVSGDAPAALEAICLKAIALSPKDRYASAKELGDDVEHWLADEPVSAHREPWTARARRWRRRHRALVAGAAAAVGVAVVSLATATGLLAAANQRERASREEVTRQRDRADANLAGARKAVEDYCTHVADDRRLKQVDLHDLRQKLLRTAVPFYEEFLAQRPDDPRLLADQARAYWRLGFLRNEMGEKLAALADYGRMKEIFARLVPLYPEEPAYRRDLATGHNNIGLRLKELGGLAAWDYRRRRPLDWARSITCACS